MKFKISDRAKAEFHFYLNSDLDLIGRTIGLPEPVADPEGYSALECWWTRDTHGKILPCCEPEVLAKALRSKQSVNLQIKLWAEDMASPMGLLLQQPELVEYLVGWPEWVLRAVVEQAGKLLLERIGFIPRFAKLEHIYGNLVLPYMDSFNPII